MGQSIMVANGLLPEELNIEQMKPSLIISEMQTDFASGKF